MDATTRSREKICGDVKQLIEFATPGDVAGFMAESIQGVGGVVVSRKAI